jgi:hypothetical protein
MFLDNSSNIIHKLYQFTESWQNIPEVQDYLLNQGYAKSQKIEIPLVMDIYGQTPLDVVLNVYPNPERFVKGLY